MKLHHLAMSARDPEIQKLREIGKALVQPVAAAVQEQTLAEALPDENTSPEMDAAIHTMTQDQKHLHKKLAHHD